MFIRETVKSIKGKKYIQHQLVESVRTPNGPRQTLILNMGFLDLPKDKWKELANSIESELHKQERLFPTDPEIETLAKHYSKVIIKEQLRCAGNNKTVYNPAPLYEKVDIHSVSTTDVKTMGAEHLAVNSLQEYGFDKILKDLKFSDKEIDYAKMLIVARLVHPASERETARGIFDLKETVILYDLTNTYFEGSKRTSRLSKPGKSKERRNDRPLVTLALTVDEDGFPKQSK